MVLVSCTFIMTCILVVFIRISPAQTCSNYTFIDNRMFSSCKDLPFFKAHFHWSYHPSNKSMNIAYRAQSSTEWVAWGINSMRYAMVGTQAIVEFRNSNGTIRAYTTSINSYNPSMKPNVIRFSISKLYAEYFNREMMIFVVVVRLLDKVTDVNHVWQTGSVTVLTFSLLERLILFKNLILLVDAQAQHSLYSSVNIWFD